MTDSCFHLLTLWSMGTQTRYQHFFWVFLIVCPLRRSISTVDRFFFVWTDRYVRYRPISGYYEPNRPLISTVILRRCNLTDRRYRPCCPEGGTEPTVDIDRDQPTGRLKPTVRTDDTCGIHKCMTEFWSIKKQYQKNWLINKIYQDIELIFCFSC